MQPRAGDRNRVRRPRRRVSSAFGVELEPTAGTAPEGVPQLIAGPEGDRALGLLQERVGRADAGIWLVGETAAGEHVNHLGRACGPEASDARGDDLPVPGRLGGA